MTAWHFARQPGERPWTIYSIVAGLVVLVMFFTAATSSTLDMNGTWPNAPTGIFQRIAIIAGFTWIAVVAWHLIRKEAVEMQPAG